MNAKANDSKYLRVAIWNLGSLTGRCAELAEVLGRGRVHIACIQKTKWVGAKSRDIGGGYKLYYYGEKTKTNGVAIAVNRDLQERVVSVNRYTDRIMSIKIMLNDSERLNIFSVYAPQAGNDENTKADFWEELHHHLQGVLASEMKVVCGDLNGHLGRENQQYSKWHGGYGYGLENAQGRDILELASAFNLAILNTYFKKKDEHLVTYKSGSNCSQIDYILHDRTNVKACKDCKVIPGESHTSQHRVLIADFRFNFQIRRVNVKRNAKIKWYKLKRNSRFTEEIRNYLEIDIKHIEETETMWSKFESFCFKRAQENLGLSKGPLQSKNETWWWSDEVQKTIKQKKELFKAWQKTKKDEDHMKYKKAKKESAKAVSIAKEIAFEKFYDSLDTPEGEKGIYKIAKQRNNSTKDMRCVKYIKDESGNTLTNEESIKKRWEEYYYLLLNDEFEHAAIEPAPRVEGAARQIDEDEVKEAVSKMKNNKATGPD
ncbi:uncharacterized protein LOC129616888 [Condylostylus longicornis]|uniref:uncharacterized protein LOC129616888 n=1 Tax=Condylostylus longicornis TaxID=2530218 RepID=UPI00244E012C|nr:uncharacterized protein LOC129616888 [Condylostylus longicornis]